MLFSEPKIPQCVERRRAEAADGKVSVLFSEPKIPQCRSSDGRVLPRRAFQCSSASRKFLNLRLDARQHQRRRGFSALQRAENSSINPDRSGGPASTTFQCSSASRKFLNSAGRACCEVTDVVSVLFSEPKIPQSGGGLGDPVCAAGFQCSSASRKFLNCGILWV